MFDFQNLEVYKKANAFHLNCKKIILARKLDSYVRDQLGRASFSIPLTLPKALGSSRKQTGETTLLLLGDQQWNALPSSIF